MRLLPWVPLVTVVAVATLVARDDGGSSAVATRAGAVQTVVLRLAGAPLPAACHASGAAGAPKTGDAAAWAPRIDKGMDTLVKHAYEGFNAMPAKGMCSNCSEEEIAAAVEYIVGKSK